MRSSETVEPTRMSEAGFLSLAGIGAPGGQAVDPQLVLPALSAFLRSHGYDDAARAIEWLHDQFDELEAERDGLRDALREALEDVEYDEPPALPATGTPTDKSGPVPP